MPPLNQFDMLFNQLKANDQVHVLEVLGTFNKTTVYSQGVITQVSAPYDEPLPQGLFPLPNQTRRKLVDVFVSCSGESKKLSVPGDKSIINDTSIGLTVATDRNEIAEMVRRNLSEFKAKREAALKYDEEITKCEQILELLGAVKDMPLTTTLNNEEITSLKNEMTEIKNALAEAKQLFTSFRQPMPNLPAITKVS